jgi:phosphopentomutase
MASEPMQTFHKCSLCEVTAESKESLQLHMKADHNPKSEYNLCEFEANNKDEMMEHVEIFHCSKTPFYVLRALREFASVVKNLSEDVHQVKSDSIIINIDMRVDKIHQRIGEKRCCRSTSPW